MSILAWHRALFLERQHALARTRCTCIVFRGSKAVRFISQQRIRIGSFFVISIVLRLLFLLAFALLQQLGMKLHQLIALLRLWN